MRRGKKAKLEAAGWVVGSVKEFLGLSEADAVLIEMKLALSHSLRDRRKKQGLSQVQLAERLQSSQSRVAKMEAGDPSVSMDLLVSSLLQLGTSSIPLFALVSPSAPRYPLFAFPAKQQCLYFLPLPQGQGELRPIPWRRWGTKGSSDPVSW